MESKTGICDNHSGDNKQIMRSLICHFRHDKLCKQTIGQ